MGPVVDSHEVTIDAPSSDAEWSIFNGRFRATDLLKTGGGVDTFAGREVASGAKVIIRRVDEGATSERMRARLIHEASVLRQLETASFRAPVETGREDGWLYLIRPRVEGETLAARIERGPLSIASALRVSADLLEALMQAHDNEVLHRDVKPANVIVAPDEPITSATLIDFGFARSAALDGAIREERVGTARYLAPEAAGLLERDVDERSDLYSFGVLLFECLAGTPPFRGSDVGDVLRQHLNTPAPSLRGLRSDVPRSLDALVQRLLQKEPEERYQSASAALADIRSIRAAVERGVADPSVVIGLHDRRPVLTEPAFVGRTVELGLLTQLVASAGAGHGGLALVEAESGGGKSRLLDELADRIQGGAWVLRGQGVDQAAQRPFQLLEGVVAGIVSAAAGDASIAAAIRERVGERVDAVVAAVPDLAATFGSDGAVNLGPEAYGETRSITALSHLLDALSFADRPTVVILDDCQWADVPTLRLLVHWHTSGAASDRNVLVIAAFRSEEAPSDFPLRRAHPLTSLALPAFGPNDVRNMAESMAGSLPPRAVDVIETLSEGSPFMAGAVLRGLVESGALVNTPEGWQIDEAELASAQTSRRAALFLVRRLELLAPSTLDLLSAGAILGKEFELEVAVHLCGQDATDVQAALDEAAHRRIVWPDAQNGRVRLLHDKLREALLSRLDTETRRRLHLRAAYRIQAIDDTRSFELAYHFDAAGRDDLALPYAMTAAEIARSQYSLDLAILHYRMAQGAVRAGDQSSANTSALAARVAEALGDVLTLRGSYDEATDQLRAGLAYATSDIGRASLRGKLGDVAFKRGDHRQARVELEGAVRDLGGRLPRTTVGYVVAVLMEVVVQAAHSLAPRAFVGRRVASGAEREFLQIRLYSRLAYVYWFSAGKACCAWAHLREMNLAERYPPSSELAQAYSEHSPVMTIVPWFKRGITYAERSLAIRAELGDTWGQGQSLAFYGVGLYAASRYREAIEKLEEAVRLLDQTGDRWEANTATWNIALARYRLGDLSAAVDVSRRLHAAATAIGDEIAAGTSLSVWSRASDGRVPADLITTQLTKGNADAQTNADLNVAEAVRLLATNAYDETVERLVEAERIVKRAGLRQEYVAPVSSWLATGLRAQLESTSTYDSVRRRALLRRARAAARRGWWIAFFYRNNAPHALRERALLAAIAHRPARARKLFARSLAIATSQEMRHEVALTRLAAAQAGISFDESSVADALEAARAELAALTVPVQDGVVLDPEVAPSLSLADRFTALLAVGREIASAPTTAAVHAAVRGAATQLLRGDDCRIIDATAGAGALVEGPLPLGTSRSMLRVALEAGRPVLLTECHGDTVDSSDSIVLSGLRSALCAAISSQGEPVAFLYVTHGSVAGLFGAAEVQMADFIATLAGAALDHVANTEARFRSLAQNSSDVITIIDRTGKIAYQSAAVTRVFGLDPLTRVGTMLADWLHPNDAPRVREILDRIASGENETVSFECRLRHEDGSWRYVETALNDLTDDPSVDGFVLNTRDITDRKAAEKELRQTLSDLTEASSLLNATLDATIDGILVVDLAGRMTSFNQRFVEMWGIPADVLADRDEQAALDYVIDQLADPAAFLQKIGELYADPDAESTDIIELKNGRVLERGSMPQRIDSDVVGRVWSFRDVTERVRAENALAIARDEAMEASRLKSEFVATTSHEIRSPMNGVIGLTGLLLETELDETQREFAEGVRSSAEALLVVINDILDFSKIEAGKLELEDAEFDLAAAIEDVTTLVAPTAAAKNLDFQTSIDPAVPLALVGDVGRLRQIILNLLTNAVKFTAEGGVQVRVTASGRRIDGRVPIRVAVEDTGVGLAIDDRSRLFEPFSQADASTTRRYGGTGLGLTICERLAHAMKGSIGVQSELGAGSTFWVEVPFELQAAAGLDASATTAAVIPMWPRTKPKNARLLIVEDNAINQLVAKEIVGRLGYSYEVAANGVEALHALDEGAFAAVLMDCYMPDMDGFEATRELRRRENGQRHTPVIAMTAGAMVEDRERCIVAGMDDYIAKPVTRASLEEVLDRWATPSAASSGA